MVYLPESSKETPLMVRLANLPWSRDTTYWDTRGQTGHSGFNLQHASKPVVYAPLMLIRT